MVLNFLLALLYGCNVCMIVFYVSRFTCILLLYTLRSLMSLGVFELDITLSILYINNDFIHIRDVLL